MTEEQKHAQAELEKTLDTLSEDELNALAGGKVTDDVKKFFQSEKGKEVLKWTGVAAGAAVGVGGAVGLTAYLIHRHKKHHLHDDLLDSNHDDDDHKNPFEGRENPLGTNPTGGDPYANI